MTRSGKWKKDEEERAYVTDTPGGVAFLGGCGDLVRLAIDAYATPSGQHGGWMLRDM